MTSIARTSQPTRAAAARKSIKWSKLLRWAFENAMALLVLIFSLGPILWLALTSFKNVADVYTTKVFVPLTLDNYVAIFTEPNSFQWLALNSLLVTVGTCAVAIPLGLAAAYVFARYHFKASQVLLVGVLVTQFIPPLVTVLPFWTLFRTIGLANTRLGLSIVYLSMVVPYSIWMLRGFIDALPIEVEEAASVDGCTELQTLRHVTMPLVMPGVITTLIFSFIMCWNEFTFALILTDRTTNTLQIGLYSTNGYRGILWEQMAATGMIIMVPVFVLSFLIRRYFIEGITMGAVK
ncbi:MAG TPA: carbohydrate ABC transporter permease [Anaerolineae bacterium]